MTSQIPLRNEDKTKGPSSQLPVESAVLRLARFPPTHGVAACGNERDSISPTGVTDRLSPTNERTKSPCSEKWSFTPAESRTASRCVRVWKMRWLDVMRLYASLAKTVNGLLMSSRSQLWTDAAACYSHMLLLKQNTCRALGEDFSDATLISCRFFFFFFFFFFKLIQR